MAGLTDRIVQAESGGDPFARNSRSSAAGSGQFLSSTWLEMLQKHKPELVRGKTKEQLLALRDDPALSREMTGLYASDNQSFLRGKGIDPNDGNTYLSHFAGAAGAAALHANPGATVEALLGPNAVAANPFLRGKTGADVINWAASKASPSQAMARSLRQRYGNEGAQPAGAPPASGPAAPTPDGMGKLKAALSGGYDADKLKDSEKLIADAQAIAAKNTNWLGAIGATALAGYGGYAREKEQAGKRTQDEQLRQGLPQSKDPMEAARLLMGSSDPQQQAIGIELYAKAAAAATKAGEESFSKTPVWGVDAEGNPALVQVSDRGRGTQTTLPEGVKVGKDPIKMDMGTHWVLLDPVTRQPIGQMPKDVAGEARQKQIGEGEGKRLIAQPETKASVRSSLSGLDRLSTAADKLKGMPGLPSATGNLQGRSFVPTLSQDTKDAETELETLKSQVAFTVLQAMRDASKSGGALGSIAVEELKMLQNNLASLDTLQGDDKFKQSLDAISEYAKGAQQRLLRGYKDTYGQDFDASVEPSDNPDAPKKVTTFRFNAQTGELEEK